MTPDLIRLAREAEVRERPILFSAPMVRAILAGSKTQTRRVVKGRGWEPHHLSQHQLIQHADPRGGLQAYFREGAADWMGIGCPYGQPGDRLWVRETFYCDNAFYPDGVGVSCRWHEVDGQRVAIPVEEQRAEMLAEDMYYRADGDPEFEGAEGPTPWRPSIHMPRWASRITLEITGVRVERLQQISEADAIAEGVADEGTVTFRIDGSEVRGAVAEYAVLWERINGPDSWNANPWVWVVEFQAIREQFKEQP